MQTLATRPRRDGAHAGHRRACSGSCRRATTAFADDPAPVPRRGPDAARLRLPDPGRRPVRAEPVHRDRGRRDLRRPAGHPARRRRHPVRLADGHGGGHGGRLDARASCSGRSSCRWPGGRCSLAANQGIVMVLAMVVVGGLVGRRRARLRRRRRLRPARGLRQGPGRRDRDRPARHHARPDHPGRRGAPIDGTRPARASIRRRRDARHRGGATRCSERDSARLTGRDRHPERSSSPRARSGGGGEPPRPPRRPAARAPRRAARRAAATRAPSRSPINPWVGAEANVAVVKYLLEQARLHGRGHDARRGGRLAGLRDRRGRRHPRELGPPRPREDLHHRQEGRPGRRPERRHRDHRLVRPGVDGHGVPGHHRLEQPQQVRRPVQDVRVGRPGPVPRQRPDVRHERRGADHEPRAQLQGRSTPAARPRRSPRSSRPPSRRRRSSATSTTRSGCTARSSSSRSTCRRTRRAATPTRRRSPATTRRTRSTRSSRRSSPRHGGDALHAGQELQVDQRRPEPRRGLHHQPGDDARTRPAPSGSPTTRPTWSAWMP